MTSWVVVTAVGVAVSQLARKLTPQVVAPQQILLFLTRLRGATIIAPTIVNILSVAEEYKKFLAWIRYTSAFQSVPHHPRLKVLAGGLRWKKQVIARQCFIRATPMLHMQENSLSWSKGGHILTTPAGMMKSQAIHMFGV